MFTLSLLPVSQPGVKNLAGARLGEALESCFPHLLDGALLQWNGIAVPLSYNYDLSTIIRDVIALVRHLRTCLTGHFEVRWSFNTFRSDWLVVMASGRVQVTAGWGRVSARLGPVENALNASPVVDANQADFMGQWVALLQFAQQALLATGYSPTELDEFDLLVEELAHHG